MGCKFDMLSYTHAYKAAECLKKAGLSASVERIKGIKNSGCGFIISVSDSCEKALEICKKNGVEPEKIYYGDAI